jgi:hypothetical protein
MTVDELDRRMTSAELTEWGAFFKLEAADIEARTKTPAARKTDPYDD